MTKQCALIRDVLPLYEEQLTSEASNEAIAAHLATCPECQAYFSSGTMVLPVAELAVETEDGELVQRVKRRMATRLVLAVAVGLFVGSLWLVNLAVSLSLLAVMIVLFLMRTSGAERRAVSVSLFVVSFVCAVVAVQRLWRLAVYADDYGGDVVLISGGEFWLYMNWVQVSLLVVMTMVTGWHALKR